MRDFQNTTVFFARIVPVTMQMQHIVVSAFAKKDPTSYAVSMLLHQGRVRVGVDLDAVSEQSLIF